MTDQFELPKPFATWKEDDDDCGAWGQADRPVFTAQQMHWAYQQGQLSRAIPEGHVVVPKEPTDAMLRPFYNCSPEELRLGYMAMLMVSSAAAPANKEG